MPLEIIISPINSKQQKKRNAIDDSQFYNNVILFSNKLINYSSIKNISGYWNLNGDLNQQEYRYTNQDRSEIRISCGIENIASEQAVIIRENITKDYNQIFKNNNLNITGSTLLALKMNKYLIGSLLNSFIIAFMIIFLSMSFLFSDDINFSYP